MNWEKAGKVVVLGTLFLLSVLEETEPRNCATLHLLQRAIGAVSTKENVRSKALGCSRTPPISCRPDFFCLRDLFDILGLLFSSFNASETLDLFRSLQIHSLPPLPQTSLLYFRCRQSISDEP
ncbi:hypothetical protein PDE_00272 [Penicillium oxalicum 114-2]|uniref:Uncharacterized protein n=1 Tax=Penicillium oxalicum (strain 114-2 / CGMCC 5302) TaxID=933388 RepID=S7Z5H0_PENO1|nr:hypothetical protein PDE_00272 [Penicillium oxalicum 114-2]